MSPAGCAWIRTRRGLRDYVRDALAAPKTVTRSRRTTSNAEVCFEKVQTYQAMRDELAALRRPRRMPPTRGGLAMAVDALPLAGSLVLVAAAALWFSQCAARRSGSHGRDPLPRHSRQLRRIRRTS